VMLLANNGKNTEAASLCEILVGHLVLDGGACLATGLPYYDPRIQKLLYAQRSKLLKFLESYPTIFHCTRPTERSHIVSLVNVDKTVDFSSHIRSALSACNEETVVSSLENKALALLNSRMLKLQRRSVKRKESVDKVELGAPVHWLVKRLHTDLHTYLRLKRFYCNDARPNLTGAIVGSAEWHLAALKELQSFLGARPTLFLVIGSLVFPLKEPKTVVAPPKLKHANHLVATDAEGMFSVTCGRSAKEMVLLVKKYYMKWNGGGCRTRFVDMTAGVGSIAVKSFRHFDRVDCYETDRTRYQLLLENVKKQSSCGSSTAEVTCYCEDSIAGMQQRNRAPVCAIFDPPWGGLGYDKSNEILFNKKPLRTILEELAGTGVNGDGRRSKPPVSLVVGIKLPLGYDIKRHLLPQNDDGKTDVRPTFVTLVHVKKIWKQLFAVFYLGRAVT
jgi:hypothetical protein